jgi:hypothetical protein
MKEKKESVKSAFYPSFSRTYRVFVRRKDATCILIHAVSVGARNETMTDLSISFGERHLTYALLCSLLVFRETTRRHSMDQWEIYFGKLHWGCCGEEEKVRQWRVYIPLYHPLEFPTSSHVSRGIVGFLEERIHMMCSKVDFGARKRMP